MTVTRVTHTDTAGFPEFAPKKKARRLLYLFMLRRQTKAMLAYGALSATLYYLLYVYSDVIREFAEMTHRGDKAFFLVPIGIALLFSGVHGLFTDRFWEALGLKAKR